MAEFFWCKGEGLNIEYVCMQEEWGLRCRNNKHFVQAKCRSHICNKGYALSRMNAHQYTDSNYSKEEQDLFAIDYKLPFIIRAIRQHEQINDSENKTKDSMIRQIKNFPVK